MRGNVHVRFGGRGFGNRAVEMPPRRRPSTLHMPMDKDGRDLFFQVISKRAETGSMIITTNKAFKDWTEVFQDNAVATAIAERLIEHGELIKIEGPSYRMKKRKQRQLGL